MVIRKQKNVAQVEIQPLLLPLLRQRRQRALRRNRTLLLLPLQLDLPKQRLDLWSIVVLVLAFEPPIGSTLVVVVMEVRKLDKSCN